MGAETADTIKVEVACARPERQRVLPVTVPAGTGARAAVHLSGIAADFPEIDAASAPIGIFGVAVADDHVLRPGDRVEIYRPLRMDPREARRLRARGAR